MAERHGIERLRWLQEVPTDPTELGFAKHVGLSTSVPRLSYLSAQEVQIEVAQALIEELIDAMRFLGSLSAPAVIVAGPDPP